MKREPKEMHRPYGRDDCALVRAGSDGTYWQSADGLVVRLAVPERQAAVAPKVAAIREPLLVLGFSADAMRE